MTKEQIRKAAEKIRLIALDIDGTSMNSRGEITCETRETIRKIIRAGYLVVPATGRGFFGLREQILKLEDIRYVISADGAVVTDSMSGRQLVKHVIPRERAALLAEKLQNDRNCIYLHLDDMESTHMAAYKTEEVYQRYDKEKGFLPPQNVFCGEMRDFIYREKREVLKMGLRFGAEDGFVNYETIVQKEFPDINCFRVDTSSLEFTASAASKATALQKLCGFLEVRPEQVCAIGDNGNDIAMLQYAGIGVAMGNAIRQAVEAADCVTASNDENGVSEFLKQTFLEKK